MTKESSYRISSNLTLFLKLGLPIFWLSFFGSIGLAIFLSQEENVMNTPMNVKLNYLGFLVLFFLILYLTIMRLKRVEMGEKHIYASNYFKTFRYSFADVERISDLDFSLFQIFTIHLKEKGAMGKKIPFLVSKSRIKEYLNSSQSALFTSKLDN